METRTRRFRRPIASWRAREPHGAHHRRMAQETCAVRVLKRAGINAHEIDGLIRSGEARLTDADNASLSLESRFDLAYNAAHALALAALRRQRYRSEKRSTIFQTLAHTLGHVLSLPQLRPRPWS